MMLGLIVYLFVYLIMGYLLIHCYQLRLAFNSAKSERVIDSSLSICAHPRSRLRDATAQDYG